MGHNTTPVDTSQNYNMFFFYHPTSREFFQLTIIYFQLLIYIFDQNNIYNYIQFNKIQIKDNLTLRREKEWGKYNSSTTEHKTTSLYFFHIMRVLFLLSRTFFLPIEYLNCNWLFIDAKSIF